MFPDAWKKSFITPIYKSGNRNNVRNYRPIAKFSIIAKMFEAIISKKLSNLLTNYINHTQHGFLVKHSIFTNLITYHNFLISASDEGNQVDSIYTDFEKALDKVDHMLLYYKLEKFGIGGHFLKWLLSFLTNCTQAVKISFHLSTDFPVLSGVPQGSHLGPLLFLIFINDLPLVLDSSINILLFADDAKIFCKIKSVDDQHILQTNLNKFVLWSENNYLPLNINKCQVISFTRKKNSSIFQYHINDLPLLNINSIKDLGIHFEHNLSFKINHKIIVNKSYKMLIRLVLLIETRMTLETLPA